MDMYIMIKRDQHNFPVIHICKVPMNVLKTKGEADRQIFLILSHSLASLYK